MNDNIIAIIICFVIVCGHRVATQLSNWPAPSTCLWCVSFLYKDLPVHSVTFSVDFSSSCIFLLNVLPCRIVLENVTILMTFSWHFNFLFFGAPVGLCRNSAVNVQEKQLYRKTEMANACYKLLFNSRQMFFCYVIYRICWHKTFVFILKEHVKE